MSAPTNRSRAIDERTFHAWLRAHLPAGSEGSLPLGDDTAALRPPPGRVALLTTDALVEGTHFLSGSPPGRIGAAAASVNLSDLAAKGAVPVGLLLALIVPPGTPARWAAAVVAGAERTMERYGGRVIGGDTKPGPVRTVVGSAIGWGDPAHLAPRTDARPGDVVAVTGTVGRGGVAAEGLRTAGPTDRRALVRMLDVRPRVREGRALARWAHAMLDTSDGLAEAARLLADASHVRIVIDEDRIPWAPGLARLASDRARRRRLGFFGGDYELLATFDPGAFGRAAGSVARGEGALTAIGRVARGTGAWLRSRSRESPMPPAGWRPFGRRVRSS